MNLDILLADKKGIIFDHDGTIADTEKLWFKAALSLLQDNTIYLDEYEQEGLFQQLLGVTLQETATLLKNRFNLLYSVDDIIKALLLAVANFYNSQLTFVEYAQPFLEKLLQYPITMAIASNSNQKLLALSDKKLGLQRFFNHHIYGIECVTHGKPAPDIYMFAAEKLKIKPSECIAIEDSLIGVQAAKNAKIGVVIVIQTSSISYLCDETHIKIKGFDEFL